MSIEPKSPGSSESPDVSGSPRAHKATPSAAEINAYLELSAARTKLRLPLAKGAATSDAIEAPSVVEAAVAPSLAKRPLPVSSSTRPSARHDATSSDEAPSGSEEVWRPFSNDDER